MTIQVEPQMSTIRQYSASVFKEFTLDGDNGSLYVFGALLVLGDYCRLALVDGKRRTSLLTTFIEGGIVSPSNSATES